MQRQRHTVHCTILYSTVRYMHTADYCTIEKQRYALVVYHKYVCYTVYMYGFMIFMCFFMWFFLCVCMCMYVGSIMSDRHTGLVRLVCTCAPNANACAQITASMTGSALLRWYSACGSSTLCVDNASYASTKSFCTAQLLRSTPIDCYYYYYYYLLSSYISYFLIIGISLSHRLFSHPSRLILSPSVHLCSVPHVRLCPLCLLCPFHPS